MTRSTYLEPVIHTERALLYGSYRLLLESQNKRTEFDFRSWLLYLSFQSYAICTDDNRCKVHTWELSGWNL